MTPDCEFIMLMTHIHEDIKIFIIASGYKKKRSNHHTRTDTMGRGGGRQKYMIMKSPRPYKDNRPRLSHYPINKGPIGNEALLSGDWNLQHLFPPTSTEGISHLNPTSSQLVAAVMVKEPLQSDSSTPDSGLSVEFSWNFLIMWKLSSQCSSRSTSRCLLSQT